MLRRILKTVVFSAGVMLALITFSTPSSAGMVTLQNGTATFSETCCGGLLNSPDKAVDGVFTDLMGGGLSSAWAIYNVADGTTDSQTAVWETATDIGPSVFNFKMYFLHENPGHLLGRFRFSVTTDDRSTFADDLAIGGDVSANWTVLTNATVQGPAEMTFTILPDDSVLASVLPGSLLPPTGIYEVSYTVNLSGITGVRLEVLEDPSLPTDGPGFYSNGNFHLTELQLNATPVVKLIKIDIKPGNDTNSINLCSGGGVPVAILGSAAFDVSTVDVDTLRFAGAAVNKVGGKNEKAQCSFKDVNEDGFVDLVCQFNTTDFVEAVDGILKGALLDGSPIEGSDTVNFVPESCPSPFGASNTSALRPARASWGSVGCV